MVSPRSVATKCGYYYSIYWSCLFGQHCWNFLWCLDYSIWYVSISCLNSQSQRLIYPCYQWYSKYVCLTSIYQATYDYFYSTRIVIILDDITLYVYNVFPPEYKGISYSIWTQDTSLQFDKLYEKLCDNEQQLQQNPNPPSFPLASNFAAKNTSSNSWNNRSSTISITWTTQRSSYRSNRKQGNQPIHQEMS